jgi:hypothetical protein
MTIHSVHQREPGGRGNLDIAQLQALSLARAKYDPNSGLPPPDDVVCCCTHIEWICCSSFAEFYFPTMQLFVSPGDTSLLEGADFNFFAVIGNRVYTAESNVIRHTLRYH